MYFAPILDDCNEFALVTWWALGGQREPGIRYVYAAANFSEKPLQATIIVVVLILVVVPLLHTLLWALTKLRGYLFRRYAASGDRISPKSPTAPADLSFSNA